MRMFIRFAVVYILLCVAVCVFGAERPTVNVPVECRQSNYGPSCVHATMVSLFRWQGRYETADYWRKHFYGGEYASELAKKLDRVGIRYAQITNGDESFLEWACKTRRGCGIAIKGGSHMVALVHLDSEWAAILDNKDVSTFKWFRRDQLLSGWSGWAVTPIYTPSAPLPESGE